MNNIYLENQPNWRYCRVRAGEKKPYPANWQNTPLYLEQVDSANIGLILGPKSNGVCAIDFDGATAWAWADAHGITNDDLDSVAWSSGKEHRCQMAFNVPEEYWPYLKTKKITTKPPSYPGAKDGEGFEFRWAGGQSVLPPSIHPDTGQPYYWINPCARQDHNGWQEVKLSTIPDNILLAWIEELNKEPERQEDTTPEVSIDDLTDKDIQEVDHALSLLKQKSPALSYDDWARVSWAVAHHLGRSVAQVLLTKYYPEQRHGEYNMLFRTYNKGKSPTIGSLMFMVGVKKVQDNTGSIAAQKFMREQNRFKGLL